MCFYLDINPRVISFVTVRFVITATFIRSSAARLVYMGYIHFPTRHIPSCRARVVWLERQRAASKTMTTTSAMPTKTVVPAAATLAKRNGDGAMKWRARQAVPRFDSCSAAAGTLVKATTETHSSSSSSDGRRRAGGAGTAAAALSAALTLSGAVQSASAETIKVLYVAAGNAAFLENEFIDLKVGIEGDNARCRREKKEKADLHVCL